MSNKRRDHIVFVLSKQEDRQWMTRTEKKRT